MKSLILILFFTIISLSKLTKYRKAKGRHLYKKYKNHKESKIIAGFESKAITPPIS